VSKKSRERWCEARAQAAPQEARAVATVGATPHLAPPSEPGPQSSIPSFTGPVEAGEAVRHPTESEVRRANAVRLLVGAFVFAASVGLGVSFLSSKDARRYDEPVAASVLAPPPKGPFTVSPAPNFQGNGYEAFARALSKVPAPKPEPKRELAALFMDPDAPLSSECVRYMRECWPAVRDLERACCSEEFARVASAAITFDLTRIQDLSVTALAVARMQTAVRAATGVGRWSMRTIRLGHFYAKDAPPRELVGALSLARCGERWLKNALEKRPWSAEELSWLAGELAAESSRREQLAAPGEDRLGALVQALEQEKKAFDEVRRLVEAKAKSSGRAQ
jgi:hypothetical protein